MGSNAAKKKVLILINESQNYRPFFTNIGRYLADQGHEVTFALTNRYTDYLYPCAPLPKTAAKFYLTDFLRANWGKSLPIKYHKYNVWLSLFPDFDRFENFRLHRKKKAQYFEQLVSTTYCFFEDLFAEKGFNVVIFENVSNLFGYAAYHAAKENHAEFLAIGSSRLPSRFEFQRTVLDESAQISDIESHSSLSLKHYEKFVEEYLCAFNDTVPDYMKQNVLDPQISIWRYFSLSRCRQAVQTMRYLREHRWEIAYLFQTENPIVFSLKMFARKLRRSLVLPFIQKFFEKEPNFTQPYFLYPIQFHPESSTSVGSWQYVNEFENIKKIAFTMPYGHVLFVKDHRSAAGFQPFEFYKMISRIPNVRLIHYDAKTKDLIRKSCGVITCTSTVGFEAVVMNIPVFLLGRVFYEKNPLVKALKSIDELHAALSEVVAQPQKFKSDSKEFLAAYFAYTFDGALKIAPNEPSLQILKAINDQI